MDTISRDNNSGGLLPWAGAILGGIGLLLGGIALAKVSSLGTKVDGENTNFTAKLDEVSTSSSKALRAATDAKAGSDNLQQYVRWIEAANPIVQTLQKDVEALKAKPAGGAGGGTKAGPVTAGKDEYIVKAGDTSGSKIATENGVKLADLMAVNPDVNWTKLQIGQKLKLPAKK